MMLKKSKSLILILFASAGFSSLVFQVVWQRELSIIFGGAIHSTAVILSSYMAGLALGSFIFGKAAATRTNRMKLFGLLQILLAGAGLALVFLPPLFDSASGAVFPIFLKSPGLYHTIIAFLAFAILLIPTTLIGGTFPVLVAEMESLSAKNSISRLYTINNIGCVAGSIVCGFILIRTFGASASAGIAVAIALSTGIAAFLTKGNGEKTAEKNADAFETENDIKAAYLKPLRVTVIALFVISGFTSLSYELLYNRTITYFVGNNTYSFTILVSIFILGLAAGSLLFSVMLRKKTKLSTLIALLSCAQIAAAAYHILMPSWTAALNSSLINLRFDLGYESLAALYFVKGTGAAMTVFVPAVIFGFIYPLVFRIYFAAAGSVTPAKAGMLSAVNTFGTAVGPLVTTFVVVAIAGVSGALRFNAEINIFIACAAGVLYFAAAKKPSGELRFVLCSLFIAAGILFFIIPQENTLGRRAALASASDKLLFYKEGVFGTVSVAQKESGVKEIRINGVGEVPTDHDSMRAFRMLAHIPFTVVDSPKSILSIAFGGGITFGSISEHRLPSTTCVEICKDVLDAAPLYEAENHGVYKNPNVRIIIMDGRKYVSGTPERFDIITSDSTHPASYDSWILYTKEFYRSCREHLNKGGVFAQWVPLHDLSVRDFKTVLKTYSSQFAHASLYLTNSYTVIIGSDSPIEPKQSNFAAMAKNPVIQRELAAVNITGTADIQRFLLMKDDDLKAYASDGDLADDDHTPLQFTESRSFSRNTIHDNMISFRDFIMTKQPAGVNAAYLEDYLKLGAMKESGEHAQLISTVASMKGADAEILYIAEKAADELKAERLSPDSISAIIAQGPEKAANMADKLIEDYPNEGVPYSVKGYLFFKEKNVEKAAEMYDRAVRLSPKNLSVLNNASTFYFKAGIFDRALFALTILDGITPGNEAVRYKMALTLLNMGKKDEAAKLIAEFRTKSGDNTFAEDLAPQM
jgi:spermidine synthase